MALPAYPVRVDATLDPHISRWLWLVKWLLAIPHFVVLALLWIAFTVVSIVAFFAIVFTGRYPRSWFEFNVGVLRWSWRVHYYTFGALATDQYPPFTLAEVPSYPAHLEIAYPERLSRGLVWVKWWLLAIPQYIVVGIFVGGGSWAVWRDRSAGGWAPGGLLGILVLIAAVVLLVTGRYPKQIFDLVLGLDRWVLRVVAYAALMTDDYPPFRLDMGGHEPGAALTVSPPPGAPPPATPAAGGAGGGAPAGVETGWTTPPPAPAPAWPPGPGAPYGARPAGRGWTGGRIASLVVGSIVFLVSMGALAGGGFAAWADNTQRDSAGFITSGQHDFTTGSYALTSGGINLGSSADAFTPSDVLGTLRVRVTPVTPAVPIFVGVAPRAAVNAYLAGVSHDQVTDWSSGTATYRSQAGGAPQALPSSVGIWTAQTSGPGTRTLTWKPHAGTWTVVVMRADGRAGLSVVADVGASVPDLGSIAAGLIAGGAVLLLLAAALVITPIVRAGRSY